MIIRKARAAHLCNKCGAEIQPGQYYGDVTVYPGNDVLSQPEHHRKCADCLRGSEGRAPGL